MPYIVAVVVCISYILFYHFIQKDDRFINNFNIKHLLFLIWIIFFFFASIYIFESKVIPLNIIIVSMFIVMLMLMVCVNVVMVTFFSEHVSDINTPRERLISITLDLGIVFFFFSFIHYVIYYSDSNAFEFNNENGNWFDIAISFLYYAFSTSLTYSASGIEPISSLAKIISMLHITIFYLILGESLFKELRRTNN